MRLAIISLLIVAYPLSTISEVCPYTTQKISTIPNGTNDIDTPDLEIYNEAVADLDLKSVFKDLYALLTDSQDCWPADTFGDESNYGGLFIRLAWHCAGTFRDTDGKGGCSGGRQRFDPEASWDDNTNLDKARALLGPIKTKYGDALSWGDLFVFAGTASIMNMGGPATEICAGRVDDYNGELSDPLGQNAQPLTADPPCFDQGNCNENNTIIGASTVGLIYVNPEGVVVDGTPNPDPLESVIRIREIFGRMGMNDSETVALIGGGHAFGKSHGACTTGPGPNPSQDPSNPWPGTCSGNSYYAMGQGLNTFTSGIEGQWTTHPFQWDNEYFTQLVEYGENYTLETGPGGKYQWRNPVNGYMMLTTDLALIYDEEYMEIVVEFAENQDVLDEVFGNVWEKLMTQGGRWADNKKCVDASELFMDTVTTEDPESGVKSYRVISLFLWVVLLLNFNV